MESLESMGSRIPMSVELTIIIPVLKESKRLELELADLCLSLIKSSINAEIIVISNKEELHLESNKYQEISKPTLQKLRAVVTHDQSAKLGRILRIGTSISDSRFVLYLLPEGKFDEQFLPKALNLLRSGSALVIANRFHKLNIGIHGSRSIFYKQRILRRLFSLVGVRNLPKDFTNSARMFDKNFFDALAISGNNWDMLAEQTIKCCLVEAKIETIDVGVNDFKVENDFRVPLAEAFLGICRLLPRTLMHKRIIPWF
jgi:hypothetical protein